MTRETSPDLHTVVRDGITRTIGAIGLAGVALIHTIDAPSHFVGGPDTWLGVMYVGLIISCLALSGALIFTGDRRAWLAAAALVASAIIGFTLSRTTGLPGDSGDIGNWGEALGIASLFVEGAFLMLAAAVLSLPITVPREIHAGPTYAAPIAGIFSSARTS
jgi:hypothetical protein